MFLVAALILIIGTLKRSRPALGFLMAFIPLGLLLLPLPVAFVSRDGALATPGDYGTGDSLALTGYLAAGLAAFGALEYVVYRDLRRHKTEGKTP
jgi:hypothetical protein